VVDRTSLGTIAEFLLPIWNIFTYQV
jgi:hypothetical protein